MSARVLQGHVTINAAGGNDAPIVPSALPSPHSCPVHISPRVGRKVAAISNDMLELDMST